MMHTCRLREDDKALSAPLEQEHMQAIYELLTDVAVDALAADVMKAYLARAAAPNGANRRVSFVDTSVWHGSLLPVVVTCSTTRHCPLDTMGRQ